MKKMIEINGLYKSYTDEEEVVKDIHMKVEKGTIHGLIGHNGSGKTTIIKCVTGIYPPDRGEVLLGGEPVYENVKVKEKIGYVADSNQMFSNYKVQQLVKMYENIFEKFSREDFQALNRIFQVPLHHRISHLSKGQQMRTAFMLNLARNPEVMVLDEPTLRTGCHGQERTTGSFGHYRRKPGNDGTDLIPSPERTGKNLRQCDGDQKRKSIH